MALIRGLRGLCPCPKCLVPKDELSDLSKTYEIRTTEATMQILTEARTKNATDKEDALKKHGLRDVNVSFSLFRSLSAMLIDER